MSATATEPATMPAAGESPAPAPPPPAEGDAASASEAAATLARRKAEAEAARKAAVTQADLHDLERALVERFDKGAPAAAPAAAPAQGGNTRALAVLAVLAVIAAAGVRWWKERHP